MPAKPITLGSITFPRRGDAEKYLQEMLKRYDIGDKVSEDDAEIVRAALERHPEARQKIGCGVADFSVRSADFNTKCFWINRTDGTTEKFSVSRCIYDPRKSNKSASSP